MSIQKKLKEYLEKNKIAHEIIKHKKVFTAFDAAQTLREDVKKIAKTLLVKADKQYYVVSIPANARLDIGKLAKALKAKNVSVTGEEDMIKVCKVKPGAMHAFGTLYNIPVLVDKTLVKAKEAIFSTGDFMESVRLKVKDYIDLEKAVLGSFGQIKKAPVKKAGKAAKNVKAKPKTKVKKNTVKAKRAGS